MILGRAVGSGAGLSEGEGVRDERDGGRGSAEKRFRSLSKLGLFGGRFGDSAQVSSSEGVPSSVCRLKSAGDVPWDSLAFLCSCPLYFKGRTTVMSGTSSSLSDTMRLPVRAASLNVVSPPSDAALLAIGVVEGTGVSESKIVVFDARQAPSRLWTDLT